MPAKIILAIVTNLGVIVDLCCKLYDYATGKKKDECNKTK